MSQNIRQTIRELIAQELANLRPESKPASVAKVREESVSIHSDQDLQAFVRRMLLLCGDQQSRADLQAGRLVFRLDRAGKSGVGSTPVNHSGKSIRVDQGLVTERQIRQLTAGVNLLELGKLARLTPLASDAARAAGINIKQVKS